MTDVLPEPRNRNEMLWHAEESKLLGKPVFEVKEDIPLINLPFFNNDDEFAVDMMHIELGLGKQLTNLWFNTSRNDYSVGKKVIEKIEEML